jgi:predicted TIM-barrel fold metal-dependent hydrolase
VAQLPLFDAHALIRSDDPARYPFQPLGPPLEQREREQGVTDAQLLEALDVSRIERAVLVQRARLYAYDNRYICDAAHRHPTRLQYVCQVDPAAGDAAQQARDWITRGAAGVRLMEPMKGADLTWLDGAGARAVWQIACDEGVPVSVHFFPWNRAAGLAVLARRLKEAPPRALVLDSLAGTAVDTGPPDYGMDDALRAVLGFPQTHLKLTGMTLARLATAKLSADALVARLTAEIGAARLLWGSDVLAPGQTHAGVVTQMTQATAQLSERDRGQLLHGTAAALYPLR